MKHLTVFRGADPARVDHASLSAAGWRPTRWEKDLTLRIRLNRRGRFWGVAFGEMFL